MWIALGFGQEIPVSEILGGKLGGGGFERTISRTSWSDAWACVWNWGGWVGL